VLRLFSVALFVMASGGLGMAADPILVVNQNLTQSLPAGGKTEVSVLVSSAQEITDAHVAVVQIRTPRGELLPVDLFTITQPPSRLSAAGAPFVLKLDDVSRFKETGDYTVTLRLTGMQKDALQAQIVSLTLNAPAPLLTISRHQNATIPARRWTPWSDASVDATLRFEETSGRANVADLKVSSQDVFVKGTTELAGASVEIAGDTNGPNGLGLTLPANGQRDIHLHVTGLRTAGTMTTALLLTSPTLATPIGVPLQIDVSDRWPLPFLVIFLGVLGGALVRHFSNVTQPREKARFRRSLLATQIVRWRDRSRDIQQVQQLDGIDDTLRRSDDRLQLDDVPAATALLDQAEAAIAEFRKGWEQRFTGVLTRLRDTDARIDDLRERIPDTETADLARLQTARDDLAAARQALSGFDVPLAESHTAAAASALDALSAAHPPPARRGLAPAPAQVIDIAVAELPADRLAGQELSFSIDDPAAIIGAGDRFEWEFGDGARLTTTVPQARHRFLSAGAFRARVGIMRGATEVAAAGAAIDIFPRPIEVLVEQQRSRLRRIAAVLTLGSLAIAVLTGLGLLFIGKSFGTPQQYVEAFLWGFGIDSSVKSVADLMKKVS
jgi:hypothetical protein